MVSKLKIKIIGKILVATLTYLLFVIFFHRLNDYEDFVSVEESYLYAYWAGSVIGPFAHMLAVAHVLLWGLPSSVVGSIVSYYKA